MTNRTLLMFTFATLLWGADWPAIPPEVWAMKEDPGRGVKGAVVLDQILSFKPMGIEHTYRVRVLSEAGRAAAEIRGLLPESTDFEGRTIQRDGTIITFNKRMDFHEKTESVPGYHDRRIKVLLPPGVTSDCVVELRWVDKVGFRNHASGDALGMRTRVLPESLGLSAEWTIGGPFKVLHATVEVPSYFSWSLAVTPIKGKSLDVSEKYGLRRFTFQDIPAWENPPFSAQSLAGLPSCHVWLQIGGLKKGSDSRMADYWNDVANSFIRQLFQTDLVSGRGFEAMAKELTGDLPADPFEKATTLLMRLERRVRNVSQPTFEETAKSTRQEEKARIDSDDLAAAATRGYTDGWGMAKLYFALARKAGLEPTLALVKDRSRVLLHYQQADVYQFEKVLVGIQAPTRQTLWLDPATRYAAPGLILPGFQGTDAILVEPGVPTWRARKEIVPIQPGQWNVSSYSYQQTCAEGMSRFVVKTGFSGYEEYQERQRFLALEPSEQERALKERLEQAIGQATINQTKVRHAQDPDQNVEWEASGERELDLADRLTFDPFPGMASPLPLPPAWPERRIEPILLDHLLVRAARCRFAIPEGYTVVPLAAMDKTNGFGKVSWEWGMTKGGGSTQLEIRLKVEVSKLFAPPEAYAELKQFIEWVREALSRRIVLERSTQR